MDDRIECYRLYLAGFTLWATGGREIAIPLIESAYRKAEKNQVLEIIYLALDKLTYYYGNINSNRKKYIQYATQKAHFDWIQQCHTITERMYRHQNLLPNLRIPSLSVEELGEGITRVENLRGDEELPPMTEFMLLKLKLDLKIAVGQSSTAEIESIFEPQEIFLSKNPTVHRLFLQHIFAVYLLTGNSKGTLKTLTRLSELTKVDAKNHQWVNLKTLEFYHNVHNLQYDLARDCVDEILNSRSLENTPEDHLERLLLGQMLLSFIGSTERHLGLVTHWKLRLSKFINEMRKVSQDKAGNNVLIYIVEVFWHVTRRRYGKADERLEALSRYLSRHGIKQSLPRLYYFSRMLTVASEANYHKAATIRKNKNNLQRLIAAKPNKMNFYSIEIIPMEELWDAFLEKMEAKMN